MNERLDRRTLTRTAGAVAGVAVAARLASAVGQGGTPAASPAAMDTAAVEAIVGAWPDLPRQLAMTVMEKYGPPQEATPSHLFWFNNGPWKRTILNRDTVLHDFPMPHEDLLEQFIGYRVPPDTFDELARYDGSVIVERTKGEISARCDMEPLNFLAINLANDVVTGARTVEDARAFYAQTAMAFKNGQSDPYLEGFVFEPPTGETADPDMPAA